jgi:hypothetical protein
MGEPTILASTKKLRYYNNDQIRDPYNQIQNAGFSVVGNLKTYGVANMYDRPEPTNLRDLKELYTVPYTTTPFLGNNTTSVKYIDKDSLDLRSPVFQNRKSAIDISQVTMHPQQTFIPNLGVSSTLNNFYEQATTINMGSSDVAQGARFVNRWDPVDPRIVQNVDNIVMNSKNIDGTTISLHSCGISSRNELRNYVEINKC